MQDEQMADVVAGQHARIRELFHDAAHAPLEQREAACGRLVRFLAVHEAAEHEALHPGVRQWPAPVEDEIRELANRTERLEDLGPRSATYTVQLGLLAAVVDGHVRRSEEDVVPRFLAWAEDSDVDRAVAALRAVDALAGEEGTRAGVPTDASFVGQLRAARTVLGGMAETARPTGGSRRDGP